MLGGEGCCKRRGSAGRVAVGYNSVTFRAGGSYIITHIYYNGRRMFIAFSSVVVLG